MFLMVRVKVQGHWGFTFPVPLYVVDELFDALSDLAWIGEIALRYVPVPREANTRKHLQWLKMLSPRGVISATQSMVGDLRRHKGLEVVDVEAGDVQVKIRLS